MKATENDQNCAADSLILLSNESRTSLCVVCGEYVKTKRHVAYDFFRQVQQYKAAERDLTRAMRKHCDDHHPEIFIWNVVPSSGILSKKDRKARGNAVDLDGLLHQAMHTAAQKLIISELRCSNSLSWIYFFIRRISYAECWINWSSEYYFKQHPPVTDPCKLRKLALDRLKEMMLSTTIILSSPQFFQRVGPQSLNFYLNLFQLYFMENGRYRKCPYLGIHSNQAV